MAGNVLDEKIILKQAGQIEGQQHKARALQDIQYAKIVLEHVKYTQLLSSRDIADILIAHTNNIGELVAAIAQGFAGQVDKKIELVRVIQVLENDSTITQDDSYKKLAKKIMAYHPIKRAFLLEQQNHTFIQTSRTSPTVMALYPQEIKDQLISSGSRQRKPLPLSEIDEPQTEDEFIIIEPNDASSSQTTTASSEIPISPSMTSIVGEEPHSTTSTALYQQLLADINDATAYFSVIEGVQLSTIERMAIANRHGEDFIRTHLPAIISGNDQVDLNHPTTKLFFKNLGRVASDDFSRRAVDIAVEYSENRIFIHRYFNFLEIAGQSIMNVLTAGSIFTGAAQKQINTNNLKRFFEGDTQAILAATLGEKMFDVLDKHKNTFYQQHKNLIMTAAAKSSKLALAIAKKTGNKYANDLQDAIFAESNLETNAIITWMGTAVVPMVKARGARFIRDHTNQLLIAAAKNDQVMLEFAQNLPEYYPIHEAMFEDTPAARSVQMNSPAVLFQLAFNRGPEFIAQHSAKLLEIAAVNPVFAFELYKNEKFNLVYEQKHQALDMILLQATALHHVINTKNLFDAQGKLIKNTDKRLTNKHNALEQQLITALNRLSYDHPRELIYILNDSQLSYLINADLRKELGRKYYQALLKDPLLLTNHELRQMLIALAVTNAEPTMVELILNNGKIPFVEVAQMLATWSTKNDNDDLLKKLEHNELPYHGRQLDFAQLLAVPAAKKILQALDYFKNNEAVFAVGVSEEASSHDSLGSVSSLDPSLSGSSTSSPVFSEGSEDEIHSGPSRPDTSLPYDSDDDSMVESMEDDDQLLTVEEQETNIKTRYAALREENEKQRAQIANYEKYHYSSKEFEPLYKLADKFERQYKKQLPQQSSSRQAAPSIVSGGTGPPPPPPMPMTSSSMGPPPPPPPPAMTTTSSSAAAAPKKALTMEEMLLAKQKTLSTTKAAQAGTQSPAPPANAAPLDSKAELTQKIKQRAAEQEAQAAADALKKPEELKTPEQLAQEWEQKIAQKKAEKIAEQQAKAAADALKTPEQLAAEAAARAAKLAKAVEPTLVEGFANALIKKISLNLSTLKADLLAETIQIRDLIVREKLKDVDIDHRLRVIRNDIENIKNDLVLNAGTEDELGEVHRPQRTARIDALYAKLEKLELEALHFESKKQALTAVLEPLKAEVNALQAGWPPVPGKQRECIITLIKEYMAGRTGDTLDIQEIETLVGFLLDKLKLTTPVDTTHLAALRASLNLKELDVASPSEINPGPKAKSLALQRLRETLGIDKTAAHPDSALNKAGTKKLEVNAYLIETIADDLEKSREAAKKAQQRAAAEAKRQADRQAKAEERRQAKAETEARQQQKLAATPLQDESHTRRQPISQSAPEMSKPTTAAVEGSSALFRKPKTQALTLKGISNNVLANNLLTDFIELKNAKAGIDAQWQSKNFGQKRTAIKTLLEAKLEQLYAQPEPVQLEQIKGVLSSIMEELKIESGHYLTSEAPKGGLLKKTKPEQEAFDRDYEFTEYHAKRLEPLIMAQWQIKHPDASTLPSAPSPTANQ